MNQTHLHLLITHLPIYGALLGGLVLAYGLFTKSVQTKIAGYCVFLIAALGAGVSYLTGEAAEDTVEGITGVVGSTVEMHEDFAIYALIALIVLGIASLAGIVLNRLRPHLSQPMGFIVLILSAISFVMVARTGYLGGKIRHTELNYVSTSVSGEVEVHEEHD